MVQKPPQIVYYTLQTFTFTVIAAVLACSFARNYFMAAFQYELDHKDQAAYMKALG